MKRDPKSESSVYKNTHNIIDEDELAAHRARRVREISGHNHEKTEERQSRSGERLKESKETHGSARQSRSKEYDKNNRRAYDDKSVYDRRNHTDRQNINAGHTKNGKKKKKHTGVKVFFGILGALIAAVLIAAVVIWTNPDLKNSFIKAVLKTDLGEWLVEHYVGESYEAYVHDLGFDESSISVNDGVSTPDGYVTFALFGVDARTEDLTSGCRTDSIIIVNVTPDGDVEMASVYRDTYLLMNNDGGWAVTSKANAAYMWGGPEGAISMLNKNYDLAITDYMVVNFWGLTNIIDLLGGLTLTVSEEEMEQINHNIIEQGDVIGVTYPSLTEYGENVTLTGAQATAYCRIRYVDFTDPSDGTVYSSDWGRTARQRYVLTSLLKQIKSNGVLALLGIADELFSSNTGQDGKYIYTSFDTAELTDLLGLIYDMNITDTQGFPVQPYYFTADLDAGNSIVANTLTQNVTLMHEFLYEQTGYDPTNDMKNVASVIYDSVTSQGVYYPDLE